MIETHRITDRAQWFALRSHDVTASDIGAVAGVDKFRTPLRVWAEKIGRIPGAADNAMMRRGRWMEPAVLTALAERHPDWEIKPCDVYLRDPAVRLGGTPDAAARMPDKSIVNVQCKVVSAPIFKDWDDEPPLSYQLQTIAENYLMGLDEGILAVLSIGTFSAELHEFIVPRHPGAEARIKKVVTDFWAKLDAGERPAVMAKMDRETINALHPEATETEQPIDLSTDNRLPELLERRVELTAAKNEIKSELDAVETEIKSKVGDHLSAIGPGGWRIDWKLVKRAGYTVSPKQYRQLKIKNIEDQRNA